MHRTFLIDLDMKAPDKIYLPKEEIEERKPWIETAYDPNWDECYIRKDALIEWLDGKMTIEGATEGFVGGYDTALKDVIDKINSM
jgi:hypothetical protein